MDSSFRSLVPFRHRSTVTPPKMDALILQPLEKSQGDSTESGSFSLKTEKRQLSMSINYALCNESMSLYGTTLLVRPTNARAKLVSLDSRLSAGEISNIEVVTDSRLKCLLGAGGDHLIASSGNVNLSDLIKREVRCCLWTRQARTLLELWDIVAPRITQRLVDEHFNVVETLDRVCGVAIVSRHEEVFLLITLRKFANEAVFELNDEWDTELSVGSGSHALEAELEIPWTPARTVPSALAMIELMRMAGTRDPHTGGYYLILCGGPNRPWWCMDCDRVPPYEGNFVEL